MSGLLFRSRNIIPSVRTKLPPVLIGWCGHVTRGKHRTANSADRETSTNSEYLDYKLAVIKTENQRERSFNFDASHQDPGLGQVYPRNCQVQAPTHLSH